MIKYDNFVWICNVGDDRNGISYNTGRPFSTYDRDVVVSSINCAVARHGGWW